MSWADEAIEKQSVYIPGYSSVVIRGIMRKGFAFIYKYNDFSERFTTSSNDMKSKISRLGSYYMSDIYAGETF